MGYRMVLLLGLAIGTNAALICSASGQDEVAVDFFPATKVFPRFTADALQHTISLAKVAENSEWMGTVGAEVPIIEIATGSYTVQAGLAVSTFNGLIRPPGHLMVYTIDYRVDFPLDVRLGALALRTGLGHISSHFADDGIEMLGRSSIQVIRDFVKAGAAYDVPWIGGFVYADVDWIYHIVPNRSKNWQFQVGGEAGDVLIGGVARLYGAVDIKAKQHVGWGTTQSYQVGVRLFIKRNLPLRLAYTYRTGFDERGQFFDQKKSMNLFGVYLEL
jgi:hypothetical protein